MIDPEAMVTMSTVSRSAAKRTPDRICNRFEGRDTTFAAFDRHVDQLTHALDAQSARTVAYPGKNCDHVFEVCVRGTRAGGLFAPLNWRLAPSEITEILLRYPPDILFVGPEFHDAAEKVLAALPPTTAIAMGGGHPDWPAYETWRDAQPDTPVEERSGPLDPALALFTSGTTSVSKAALISHHGLLRQRLDTLPQKLIYDHWDDDEIGPIAMPLAHIGGIGFWNISFVNTCTSVIAREFDPVAALDFFEKERVSKLFVVPAALQIMIQHPGAQDGDFSRVRDIMYGTAPMPLPLLQEAVEVIGCQFAQCYGMTETTGTVAIRLPDDHVPEGSARMRSDGWLLSGDAGYLDEDGHLFIHDRIKDMIISCGENVYPAEVESVLHGHPAIREAAVIGVRDEKWGEAVMAVVTLREGAEIDQQEVTRWMRERLTVFKCPKQVDVIDLMPRNASGKLLKRDLRAQYWEGRDRQVN